MSNNGDVKYDGTSSILHWSKHGRSLTYKQTWDGDCLGVSRSECMALYFFDLKDGILLRP